MERAQEHRNIIRRQKGMSEDRVDTNSETAEKESSGASRVWDAKDLITDGKYEQAITILDEVIENRGTGSAAYGLRGIAKMKLDRYEAAIEDHNKAIELDPEFATTYKSRGNAYSDLGNYERAIEDYDKAIELNPEYKIAYNNRGNTYNDVDNYERAIEDYDKAIELDPEYSTAYYNRGNTYSDLGDYGQAIEDYDEAIKLDPEYEQAYNNRVEARLKMEAYEKARDDAKQAYKIADGTDQVAISLLLLIVSETVIDEPSDDLEQECRDVCTKDFTTSWDSTELERWLEKTDLDDEDEDFIREMIALLEEHNPDT
jgi:tetratricopeptide (TPR) repeat protein